MLIATTQEGSVTSACFWPNPGAAWTTPMYAMSPRLRRSLSDCPNVVQHAQTASGTNSGSHITAL